MYKRQHQTRAQIRLGHDGRERNEQHPEHLAVLAPIVQRALVAGQKARGEEHHRDLRELAGLHLHADLDPGLRPHARVGAEEMCIRDRRKTLAHREGQLRSAHGALEGAGQLQMRQHGQTSSLMEGDAQAEQTGIGHYRIASSSVDPSACRA